MGTVRKQLRPWGALVVAAALTFGSDGFGQSEEDLAARRQAAQDLADSAFDLLQKERYSAAAELFDKADETFHSPVFVVYQAEALEKLEKYLAARRLLQSVVDEKLADYAPDAFREAQDEAKDRIAALDERIPTITVEVAGADAGTQVALDGSPFAGRLGEPLQVDPGEYEIEVTGPAGRTDRATLEVAEGDREVVALDVSAPGDAIDSVPTEPPSEGDGEGGLPPWILPTIAYGIGGVGLIMGAAAGGVFLGKQSELEEACENDGDGDPKTCPSEQQSEGDSVKTLGNLSTAGWVIAGIGAVAGTVLLFVPIGEQGSVVSVELHLGPGWAGVGGAF